MTVWKAQDDHPLRAMIINEEGYLESFLKTETPDTNRQSYQDVYFYDQGPWTVRMSTILRSEQTKEGPGPWWWMGKNCKAIERIWATGRDTHTRSEEHTSELQSRGHLVCRLLLEKKKINNDLRYDTSAD